MKLFNYVKKIKKLEEKINDLIKENDKIEEFKSEIIQLREENKRIPKLEEKINDLIKENNKIKEFESEIIQLREENKRIPKLKEEINNLIETNKNLERRIKELSDEKNNISSRLEYYVDKIESPYKKIVSIINLNEYSQDIYTYLGIKKTSNFSKELLIFSLVNDNQLAKKIAEYYGNRGNEEMKESDFEIIKSVNEIYQSKQPWGILYAEPSGEFKGSLVRDYRGTRMYQKFSGMFSPAYRPNTEDNAPIKGKVDGES